MTQTSERIPFQIEISRVIEVLAKQIYQSPLALLRENTQNAYDAILLRATEDPGFQGRIDIFIAPHEIRVSDNGVGMSREDLENHYWRAGSSSKNTAAARAAGVVGTFGIGAMANFGIAGELVIITEHYLTHQRTRSRAKRDTLSVTERCIDLEPMTPTGQAGTTVIATILPAHAVNVEAAIKYISEFVAFLDVPVYVNGSVVSRTPIERAVPRLPESWKFSETDFTLGSRLRGDVELVGAANGEMWLRLERIHWEGADVRGRVVLRQGASALRTFRSGFGLATVGVNSAYNFGGIADFLLLEPTAGREALATASMQLLQAMMTEIDDFCSSHIAESPESDSNTGFMNWIVQHGRYNLCGNLRINMRPGDPLRLGEVKNLPSTPPILVYTAQDPTIIAQHGSEERPLLLVSQSSPRRQCQLEFLRRFCKIEEISVSPTVVSSKPPTTWSLAESALSFRIATILEVDYFLRAQIHFGKISHGLPLLVEPLPDTVVITLDSDGATVRILLGLYDTDFDAFGSILKDFVRNAVFPKVSHLVPSATRQGAEAFLRTIRRSREVFEYDIADLGDLPSIWQDVIEGRLTVAEATERSIVVARASIQVLEPSSTALISAVVPDVVQNEAALRETAEPIDDLAPTPAVTRLDRSSDAKLLLISESEPALRGYRCFLAITERVRQDKGTFFLQPHRTSVVWGGQRALFIFQHHSGRFGLYYDLQSTELIADQSGGGSFPSCTIALQNAIFIPVPESIRASFIPKVEQRKRFEIRCDILRTNSLDTASA